MTLDPVLATSAQAGAAVVVLLGAFAKMRRPAAFSQALAGYRLPDALTAPVAFAIPLAEAIGAAALLFPDTRTAGAIGSRCSWPSPPRLRSISCAATPTSTAAVPASRRRADAPRGIGWLHVGRVLLLAALAATALVEPGARAVVWFDYLTLFFSVLLIVCALLTVDVLLANAPRLSHLRNS